MLQRKDDEAFDLYRVEVERACGCGDASADALLGDLAFARERPERARAAYRTAPLGRASVASNCERELAPFEILFTRWLLFRTPLPATNVPT